jgi:hypothetical protein
MIYENLYVGSIHDNYMSEAYIKKAGEIIDEAVEGLRSSTTGDEFVIFTCEIMSTEPDPLGSGGNIYRMSKSYFDKTVYDRIVKSNHRARSSMGLYTNPYGDGTEDSNISHSKYFSDVYIFKDGSWTKKTQAQYEKEQQQKEQQQQQKEQAKLDEEERKQEVAYCRRFGYNTWTKDGGCSGDRHDEPYDSACRTAGYDGGFKGDKLIYCWSDDDDGRFPTSYQSLKQINRE